jgi:hypothetical protein
VLFDVRLALAAQPRPVGFGGTTEIMKEIIGRGLGL